MRLRTLPVSIAGVVAGCGCAAMAGSFRWLPALICLIFAVLAQITSNFANEYYDFRNGFDRKGREGFRRGVTEGDITPESMKRATYTTLALACLTGLTLLFFGEWWLIPIGIAIALFALAYSTGPFPLSHHGLGDLAVIVFFGIVPVTLTCYVQAGSVAAFSTAVWCISVAIGLMAANVLIVNNYRDIEDDRSVGKHTTVVIFGRRVMAMVYLLFFWGAIALCAAVTMTFLSPLWWIFYGVAAIISFLLYGRLTRNTGTALNPQLGMTAMTLLAFSVTLSVALSTAC